jgi:ArsR family transcriptional regulator
MPQPAAACPRHPLRAYDRFNALVPPGPLTGQWNQERGIMSVRPGSLQALTDTKADLFKALAHPARVGILEILSGQERATVAQLSDGTGVKASHLSQHLAVLRRRGLAVAIRSEGQLYYRLAGPEVSGLLAAARALLQADLEASTEMLQQSLAETSPGPGPQVRGREGGTEPAVRCGPDMEAVIESRSLIEDAVAVLVERHGWDRDAALEALLDTARSRNIGLREAAGAAITDASPSSQRRARKPDKR